MDNTLPISITIPAHFEEKYIGRLLESIKRQLYKPLEVFVAISPATTDKTKEIVESCGYTPIEGGGISVARNNGARLSHGEYLFFFDADTILPHDSFLLEVYSQILKHKIDVGSTLFTLDDESQKFATARMAYENYEILKKLSAEMDIPFIESGAFLFAKKSVFDAINGFDFESCPIGIPEDLDLMQRAIKNGYHYKVIDSRIILSGRRYKYIKDLTRTVFASIIAGQVIKDDNLRKNERVIKMMNSMYKDIKQASDRKKTMLGKLLDYLKSRVSRPGEKKEITQNPLPTYLIITTIGSVITLIIWIGASILKAMHIIRKRFRASEVNKR